MMYLKTLEILHWNIWTWSCSFLSVPGLTWKACLKKTNVKLELLTDNDMLLMFEKGIRGEFVKQHIDTLKPIINTWKIMIKIKNNHI